MLRASATFEARRVCLALAVKLPLAGHPTGQERLQEQRRQEELRQERLRKAGRRKELRICANNAANHPPFRECQEDGEQTSSGRRHLRAPAAHLTRKENVRYEARKLAPQNFGEGRPLPLALPIGATESCRKPLDCLRADNRMRPPPATNSRSRAQLSTSQRAPARLEGSGTRETRGRRPADTIQPHSEGAALTVGNVRRYGRSGR